MAEKEALENQGKPGNKSNLGILLGGVALILVLVVFLWIGMGGKDKTVPPEPPPVVQETVVSPPPEAKKPEPAAKANKAARTVPPVIPTATKAPEIQVAQPEHQPPPSLGISINEFCQRFNANSEHVKSKLRIMDLAIVEQGELQNVVKHVFNENLYLTCKVNNSDASVADVNLVGVLNGSLATTVDLNQGIGSTITAFIPGLSQEGRESILNALGVNKITSGVFNLQEQVTQNGITYWVKSSRKDGLHFGVKRNR